MIFVSVSSTTSGPIVIWVKSRTTILTGGGRRDFEVMVIVVYRQLGPNQHPEKEGGSWMSLPSTASPAGTGLR